MTAGEVFLSMAYFFAAIWLITHAITWWNKHVPTVKETKIDATKTFVGLPDPAGTGPQGMSNFIDGDKWLNPQKGKLYIRVNRAWTEIDPPAQEPEEGTRV